VPKENDVKKIREREQGLWKKYPPDDPHHLPSNDGITAVCTNTKIEIHGTFFVGVQISKRDFLLVKVGGHDFVSKKYIDIA
jgi:hypothetical protein